MSDRTTARLVAVAALAFLLFNAPLVALFDGDVRVLGLPVLWLYLTLAWLLVVVLAARAGRD